ncbi:MAG: hypothetical protein LBN95_09530 [Prevotellaceae bacterium]|jgi:hypothetical protein|nr:hypothetical protein [Prevotellaceae bacterium]
MKKLILCVCILLSLSACDNKMPDFNDTYQVRNISGNTVTIHTYLGYSGVMFQKAHIGSTRFFYTFNIPYDTLIWESSKNDSTVVFETEGKFYVEKSDTGYSILNTEFYKKYESDMGNVYEFSLTKEYLLSLPEIDNPNN